MSESILITPAEAEPVGVDETMTFLNIGNEDDAYKVDGLIAAARQAVEDITGRALVTQTWEDRLCIFPCSVGQIQILRPVLQTIVSVKYLDSDGVLQTLVNTAYGVDTAPLFGRIYPAYGTAWPTVRSQPGAVQIRYQAGYGEPEDVPEPIRLAIKLMVGHWYDTPQEPIPPFVDGLLSPYKAWRF